jgi:hypothetical protein
VVNKKLNKIIKISALALMPVFLGSIAFIVVVGFKNLNPNNVAWLFADFDMTLEYLWWSFYRH